MDFMKLPKSQLEASKMDMTKVEPKRQDDVWSLNSAKAGDEEAKEMMSTPPSQYHKKEA